MGVCEELQVRRDRGWLTIGTTMTVLVRVVEVIDVIQGGSTFECVT